MAGNTASIELLFTVAGGDDIYGGTTGSGIAKDLINIIGKLNSDTLQKNKLVFKLDKSDILQQLRDVSKNSQLVIHGKLDDDFWKDAIKEEESFAATAERGTKKMISTQQTYSESISGTIDKVEKMTKQCAALYRVQEKSLQTKNDDVFEASHAGAQKLEKEITGVMTSLKGQMSNGEFATLKNSLETLFTNNKGYSFDGVDKGTYSQITQLIYESSSADVWAKTGTKETEALWRERKQIYDGEEQAIIDMVASEKEIPDAIKEEFEVLREILPDAEVLIDTYEDMQAAQGDVGASTKELKNGLKESNAALSDTSNELLRYCGVQTRATERRSDFLEIAKNAKSYGIGFSLINEIDEIEKHTKAQETDTEAAKKREEAFKALDAQEKKLKNTGGKKSIGSDVNLGAIGELEALREFRDECLNDDFIENSFQRSKAIGGTDEEALERVREIMRDELEDRAELADTETSVCKTRELLNNAIDATIEKKKEELAASKEIAKTGKETADTDAKRLQSKLDQRAEAEQELKTLQKSLSIGKKEVTAGNGRVVHPGGPAQRAISEADGSTAFKEWSDDASALVMMIESLGTMTKKSDISTLVKKIEGELRGRGELKLNGQEEVDAARELFEVTKKVLKARELLNEDEEKYVSLLKQSEEYTDSITANTESQRSAQSNINSLRSQIVGAMKELGDTPEGDMQRSLYKNIVGSDGKGGQLQAIVSAYRDLHKEGELSEQSVAELNQKWTNYISSFGSGFSKEVRDVIIPLMNQLKEQMFALVDKDYTIATAKADKKVNDRELEKYRSKVYRGVGTDKGAEIESSITGANNTQGVKSAEAYLNVDYAIEELETRILKLRKERNRMSKGQIDQETKNINGMKNAIRDRITLEENLQNLSQEDITLLKNRLDMADDIGKHTYNNTVGTNSRLNLAGNSYHGQSIKELGFASYTLGNTDLKAYLESSRKDLGDFAVEAKKVIKGLQVKNGDANTRLSIFGSGNENVKKQILETAQAGEQLGTSVNNLRTSGAAIESIGEKFSSLGNRVNDVKELDESVHQLSAGLYQNTEFIEEDASGFLHLGENYRRMQAEFEANAAKRVNESGKAGKEDEQWLKLEDIEQFRDKLKDAGAYTTKVEDQLQELFKLINGDGKVKINDKAVLDIIGNIGALGKEVDDIQMEISKSLTKDNSMLNENILDETSGKFFNKTRPQRDKSGNVIAGYEPYLKNREEYMETKDVDRFVEKLKDLGICEDDVKAKAEELYALLGEGPVRWDSEGVKRITDDLYNMGKTITGHGERTNRFTKITEPYEYDIYSAPAFEELENIRKNKEGGGSENFQKRIALISNSFEKIMNDASLTDEQRANEIDKILLVFDEIEKDVAPMTADQAKAAKKYYVDTEGKAVKEALASARAQGDLSENAEWDAAKERQRNYNAKLQQYDRIIAEAGSGEGEGVSILNDKDLEIQGEFVESMRDVVTDLKRLRSRGGNYRGATMKEVVTREDLEAIRDDLNTQIETLETEDSFNGSSAARAITQPIIDKLKSQRDEINDILKKDVAQNFAKEVSTVREGITYLPKNAQDNIVGVDKAYSKAQEVEASGAVAGKAVTAMAGEVNGMIKSSGDVTTVETAITGLKDEMTGIGNVSALVAQTCEHASEEFEGLKNVVNGSNWKVDTDFYKGLGLSDQEIDGLATMIDNVKKSVKDFEDLGANATVMDLQNISDNINDIWNVAETKSPEVKDAIEAMLAPAKDKIGDMIECEHELDAMLQFGTGAPQVMENFDNAASKSFGHFKKIVNDAVRFTYDPQKYDLGLSGIGGMFTEEQVGQRLRENVYHREDGTTEYGYSVRQSIASMDNTPSTYKDLLKLQNQMFSQGIKAEMLSGTEEGELAGIMANLLQVRFDRIFTELEAKVAEDEKKGVKLTGKEATARANVLSNRNTGYAELHAKADDSATKEQLKYQAKNFSEAQKAIKEYSNAYSEFLASGEEAKKGNPAFDKFLSQIKEIKENYKGLISTITQNTLTFKTTDGDGRSLFGSQEDVKSLNSIAKAERGVCEADQRRISANKEAVRVQKEQNAQTKIYEKELSFLKNDEIELAELEVSGKDQSGRGKFDAERLRENIAKRQSSLFGDENGNPGEIEKALSTGGIRQEQYNSLVKLKKANDDVVKSERDGLIVTQKEAEANEDSANKYQKMVEILKEYFYVLDELRKLNDSDTEGRAKLSGTAASLLADYSEHVERYKEEGALTDAQCDRLDNLFAKYNDMAECKDVVADVTKANKEAELSLKEEADNFKLAEAAMKQFNSAYTEFFNSGEDAKDGNPAFDKFISQINEIMIKYSDVVSFVDQNGIEFQTGIYGENIDPSVFTNIIDSNKRRLQQQKEQKALQDKENANYDKSKAKINELYKKTKQLIDLRISGGDSTEITSLENEIRGALWTSDTPQAKGRNSLWSAVSKHEKGINGGHGNAQTENLKTELEYMYAIVNEGKKSINIDKESLKTEMEKLRLRNQLSQELDKYEESSREVLKYSKAENGNYEAQNALPGAKAVQKDSEEAIRETISLMKERGYIDETHADALLKEFEQEKKNNEVELENIHIRKQRAAIGGESDDFRMSMVVLDKYKKAYTEYLRVRKSADTNDPAYETFLSELKSIGIEYKKVVSTIEDGKVVFKEGIFDPSYYDALSDRFTNEKKQAEGIAEQNKQRITQKELLDQITQRLSKLGIESNKLISLRSTTGERNIHGVEIAQRKAVINEGISSNDIDGKNLLNAIEEYEKEIGGENALTKALKDQYKTITEIAWGIEDVSSARVTEMNGVSSLTDKMRRYEIACNNVARFSKDPEKNANALKNATNQQDQLNKSIDDTITKLRQRGAVSKEFLEAMEAEKKRIEDTRDAALADYQAKTNERVLTGSLMKDVNSYYKAEQGYIKTDKDKISTREKWNAVMNSTLPTILAVTEDTSKLYLLDQKQIETYKEKKEEFEKLDDEQKEGLKEEIALQEQLTQATKTETGKKQSKEAQRLATQYASLQAKAYDQANRFQPTAKYDKTGGAQVAIEQMMDFAKGPGLVQDTMETTWKDLMGGFDEIPDFVARDLKKIEESGFDEDVTSEILERYKVMIKDLADETSKGQLNDALDQINNKAKNIFGQEFTKGIGQTKKAIEALSVEVNNPAGLNGLQKGLLDADSSSEMKSVFREWSEQNKDAIVGFENAGGKVSETWAKIVAEMRNAKPDPSNIDDYVAHLNQFITVGEDASKIEERLNSLTSKTKKGEVQNFSWTSLSELRGIYADSNVKNEDIDKLLGKGAGSLEWRMNKGDVFSVEDSDVQNIVKIIKDAEETTQSFETRYNELIQTINGKGKHLTLEGFVELREKYADIINISPELRAAFSSFDDAIKINPDTEGMKAFMDSLTAMRNDLSDKGGELTDSDKGVLAVIEEIQTAVSGGELQYPDLLKLIEDLRNAGGACDAFKEPLEEMMDAIQNGAPLDIMREKVDNVKAQFPEWTKEVNKGAEAAQTFGNKIKKSFGTNLVQKASSMVMMTLTRSVKQIYTNIKNLESALAQLEIVTKDADVNTSRFAEKLSDAAISTATSISSMAESITSYARLGYSLNEATTFAELTAKYSKVANVDVSSATTNITGIIKAFDLSVNDLEEVLDELITVGNNFAISSAELGEGLNNAAAALVANGNTLEESLGLLAAANSTIQDVSRSSTGVRTIAARLSNSTSELEELGEDTSEIVSTANLAKEMETFGIEIMDANNELRSTYDILSDVAAKWDTYSNTAQASIASLLAGTRQQAVFYSVIQNWDDAEAAVEECGEAGGELVDSYGIYIDTIEGRLAQLSAQWEEFSANLLESDAIKTIVNVLRGLLEVLNQIAPVIKNSGMIWVMAITMIVNSLIKKFTPAATEATVANNKLNNSLEKGEKKGLAKRLGQSFTNLGESFKKFSKKYRNASGDIEDGEEKLSTFDDETNNSTSEIDKNTEAKDENTDATKENNAAMSNSGTTVLMLTSMLSGLVGAIAGFAGASEETISVITGGIMMAGAAIALAIAIVDETARKSAIVALIAMLVMGITSLIKGITNFEGKTKKAARLAREAADEAIDKLEEVNEQLEDAQDNLDDLTEKYDALIKKQTEQGLTSAEMNELTALREEIAVAEQELTLAEAAADEQSIETAKAAADAITKTLNSEIKYQDDVLDRSFMQKDSAKTMVTSGREEYAFVTAAYDEGNGIFGEHARGGFTDLKTDEGSMLSAMLQNYDLLNDTEKAWLKEEFNTIQEYADQLTYYSGDNLTDDQKAVNEAYTSYMKLLDEYTMAISSNGLSSVYNSMLQREYFADASSTIKTFAKISQMTDEELQKMAKDLGYDQEYLLGNWKQWGQAVADAIGMSFEDAKEAIEEGSQDVIDAAAGAMYKLESENIFDNLVDTDEDLQEFIKWLQDIGAIGDLEDTYYTWAKSTGMIEEGFDEFANEFKTYSEDAINDLIEAGEQSDEWVRNAELFLSMFEYDDGVWKEISNRDYAINLFLNTTVISDLDSYKLSFSSMVDDVNDEFGKLSSALSDITDTGIVAADTMQEILEDYKDLLDYFEISEDYQGYVLKDEYADWDTFDVMADYFIKYIQQYIDRYTEVLETYNEALEAAQEAKKALDDAESALANTSKDDSEAYETAVDNYSKALEEYDNVLDTLADEEQKLSDSEANIHMAETVANTELREEAMSKITDEIEEQTDALEDQLDTYQDLIDLRKDLLQTYQDEISYQKELADKTKSVSDLETQLAVAQLDNSAAGLARQRELQSELDSAKEELDEFTLENAIDRVTNQLEKEGEEFERVINKQTEALENKADELAKNFSLSVNYTKDSEGNITGIESITSSYHTGGFVGGEINDNEEFAKLLKGEFVATPAMMQQFMDTTLPGIAEAASATKNLGGYIFNSPLITLNCEGITTEAIPSMEKIVKRAVSEVEKHIDSGFSRAGRNTRSLNLSL